MARHRKRTDKTPLILIPALAVVAIAALGAVWWMAAGPSPYAGVDTSTFCRTDGHRSITVVLVDATDPFTPEQGDRLLNELRRVRDAVPRFDKIELFSIDSSQPNGIGVPLLETCNPGIAADADKFRENSRIIASKYAALFDKPFQAALNRILASATQGRSPIIEAIEDATVKSFGSLPENADVSKHLIIISDMLQNTDGLSFYKGALPQFPGFETTDAFRLHRPALAHVDVSIWEINRPSQPGAPQAFRRSAIAKFWADYFVAQGAALSPSYWDATKI